MSSTVIIATSHFAWNGLRPNFNCNQCFLSFLQNRGSDVSSRSLCIIMVLFTQTLKKLFFTKATYIWILIRLTETFQVLRIQTLYQGLSKKLNTSDFSAIFASKLSRQKQRAQYQKHFAQISNKDTYDMQGHAIKALFPDKQTTTKTTHGSINKTTPNVYIVIEKPRHMSIR